MRAFPVTGRLPEIQRLRVKTMRRFVFFVPILFLLLGPSLDGQQTAPPAADQPSVTFRAEVNFVEIDAIVTDADGNFVHGLQASDFEIHEDGERQAIEAFGVVDIPLERAERPLFAEVPIEPDVVTNAREYDGRLYLMILDDLHTNALRSRTVKEAARRFIERDLGANDQVAIVYTSGRSDASQEFTNSRVRLLASIDKFVGRKLRSPTLERIEEYERQLRGRRPEEEQVSDSNILDPLDSQRGLQAQTMLRTLKASAELLTNVRGRRKTLLLISEGIDYNIYDYVASRYSSTVLDDVRDVIATATRGNVAIYSIDPRGLTAGMEDSIEMLAPSLQPTIVDISPQSFTRDVRISQDSLRVFAEETGGMAFVGSNDIASAFQQVVVDNSSYYILGYHPTNDKRNGRFRSIEVRTTRPGLRVRARKGYVAPTGKPREIDLIDVENTSLEVREALNNPLQVSGLTMAATAAAFKGDDRDGSVSVTVQLSGPGLQFTEQDGRFRNTIELSIVALDRDGKIRGGDRQEVAMELKPETYELVHRGGMRLQSRLSLKPGQYHLRVAGRETSGRVGSVFYDLDVPDYSDGDLIISDVLMTSIEATAGTATARADEQLKDLLPGPPTTDRSFAQDDEITLFADVYDNETTRPHKVDITTSVLSTEGTTMFKAEDERDSSELAGRPGGYGHAATVPLQNMAPGLYVLRVEARSRLKSDEPVVREVPFRVRPAGTPREFGG